MRVSSPNRVELNVAHREVECTSKIVDDIADNEQDSLWGGLVHAYAKQAVPCLLVILDENTVGACLGVVSPSQVKVVDVFVGPFDL